VRAREGKHSLDLHGVSHEEAGDIVHQFVNAHWHANVELHIITGHSARMKSIVRSVLKCYDLEVFEADPRNSGYIRVQTWQE